MVALETCKYFVVVVVVVGGVVVGIVGKRVGRLGGGCLAVGGWWGGVVGAGK